MNLESHGRQTESGKVKAASTGGQDVTCGQIKVHRGFTSRHLAGARDIAVYTPPGYDSNTERSYPVLYMQDGQNLFDPRTAYVAGRTWRMDEHANAAIAAGEVESLVIVGVYNTGERRISEYTPEPDWQLGGGEAENYGQLLIEELMPWIASQYRVSHERERTGLGGSSLGALAALYLGLRHPEKFGRLAVFSPSVWWNRKSILNYLDGQSPQLKNRPRVWLDVGDQEGRRTVENTEQLCRRLQENGWVPEETLHFERAVGGTHDEESWAMRVRPMLGFLFPVE